MLNFLSQYSNAISLLFSLVVTASTAIYAVLTWRLVSETRKMREVQTEPKLDVTLYHRDEWVSVTHLLVRNIGLGPAYRIRITITAEAGGEGAEALISDFTRAKFFERGLTYLGPGQQQASGMSVIAEKFEQKIRAVLAIDLRYQGATGKEYREQFRIDFSESEGKSAMGRPHLYAIAQHLEKMQRDIQHMASGFHRLKVNVYDSDDREREKKEWEEERAKRLAQGKDDSSGQTATSRPASE